MGRGVWVQEFRPTGDLRSVEEARRLNIGINKIFRKNIAPRYTDDDDSPSSEAAVTPPLRMRDDLNLKKAKAEALAPLAAALAVARYEVLARHVDLLNPQLAEDERLRRAEHLLTT